ncbi:MAG: DUF5668 domain-containing protein [Patescibacteria group bacterium]|jgi:hypothetical protein
MFLGLLIFALGVIFLFQNLGYISASVWSIIWPALVIVAGLSLIFKNKPARFIKEKKSK